MIKKRYIKRIYIEELYCDKCGSKMESTGVGVCLATYPAQYPYQCSNKLCNKVITLQENELPGKLKYEFEDEENV